MQQLAIDALLQYWDCRAESLSVVGVEEGRQCFQVKSNLGSLFVKVQEAPDGVNEDILLGLRIQSSLTQNGIRTSEILKGKNGLGYAEAGGCCVTVEIWADQEDLQPGASTWEELGILCGRLHALPVPSRLKDLVSRLDPLRTLDEVRACIARHRDKVPDEFRHQVQKHLIEAEALSYLEELPRTIVHSDLTWGNVVRHNGELILIDLEGAGVAPAILDLVEVTTKLCKGPSASGPIRTDSTCAFYRGYRTRRTLTDVEVESLPDAHLFHQLYFLANALERGDLDYINRMEARLSNWRGGAFGILVNAASR